MELSKEDIFEDYEKHGGYEGLYKPGDDLYSENGMKYYPVSRWALDPDEIKPIKTTNLDLIIEFKRDNSLLCTLDFSEVFIPESQRNEEDITETKKESILNAALIAKDAVDLEVGDEEWVNGELKHTLTEEDINNIYKD